MKEPDKALCLPDPEPPIGRMVVDPLGRVVEVVGHGVDASGPYVEVRLAGPYGARLRYAVTMLRSRW